MVKSKYIAQRKKKPTSPRVKAWLDAGKNESILLGPVAQHLQSQPDDRDATVIHPSEMAKSTWCPRATWHRLMKHPIEKEQRPNALRGEVIFAEGHDIHRKWQKWMRDMGILYGVWRCIHCHYSMWEWSDNLVVTMCDNGVTQHQWEYKEVPLSEPKLRIFGHADGIINPSAEETFIFEAKSIGPGTLRKLDVLEGDEADFIGSDKFRKITRPLGDHFRQAQIYIRLARKNTGIPIERAVVLYEYKADQQVREFVVTHNNHWTDHMFDTAADIAWAVDNDREVKCPYGGCPDCRIYEEK